MVMDAVQFLQMDVQRHIYNKRNICHNCDVHREEVDANNAVCIRDREKPYNGGIDQYIPGIGRIIDYYGIAIKDYGRVTER